MHSSPPSRNWAASWRSQHQRSTRCLRWYRNVAGRLDSTAMMPSAKPGLSSAKFEIAAGGARLATLPRLSVFAAEFTAHAARYVGRPSNIGLGDPAPGALRSLGLV